MSTPEMQGEEMRLTGIGVGGSRGVKERKVETLVLSGAGHLLTMEIPGNCAKIAGDWLGRWQRNHQKEEKASRKN